MANDKQHQVQAQQQIQTTTRAADVATMQPAAPLPKPSALALPADTDATCMQLVRPANIYGHGMTDTFEADPKQGKTITVRPYGVELRTSMHGKSEYTLVPTAGILMLRCMARKAEAK